MQVVDNTSQQRLHPLHESRMGTEALAPLAHQDAHQNHSLPPLR
jgi:hypothetical protein